MTWRSLLTPHGRDVVFDLVTHVAWADGRLTPVEIVATQGAASALGLALRDLGAALLSRRTRTFDQLDLASLAPLERGFAYGAAAWLAASDGRIDTTEYHILRRARRALGLADSVASRIEGWAWGVRRGAIHVGEHALELDMLLGSIAAALLGDEPVLLDPPVIDAPVWGDAKETRRRSS